MDSFQCLGFFGGKIGFSGQVPSLPVGKGRVCKSVVRASELRASFLVGFPLSVEGWRWLGRSPPSLWLFPFLLDSLCTSSSESEPLCSSWGESGRRDQGDGEDFT